MCFRRKNYWLSIHQVWPHVRPCAQCRREGQDEQVLVGGGRSVDCIGSFGDSARCPPNSLWGKWRKAVAERYPGPGNIHRSKGSMLWGHPKRLTRAAHLAGVTGSCRYPKRHWKEPLESRMKGSQHLLRSTSESSCSPGWCYMSQETQRSMIWAA